MIVFLEHMLWISSKISIELALELSQEDLPKISPRTPLEKLHKFFQYSAREFFQETILGFLQKCIQRIKILEFLQKYLNGFLKKIINRLLEELTHSFFKYSSKDSLRNFPGDSFKTSF